MQLGDEVKCLLLKLGETPENSQEGLYSCRCSTTSPVDQETLKKNASQMPISFLFLQEDLEQDNGHLLVLVLKSSGSLSVEIVPKVNGAIWWKGCCWNSHKADVQFSVLQVHCPKRLKSKGHGKLSMHYSADLETNETVFRTIISANQLSLYGAVAEMCEECESLHDRSGQPDKVMGQSIVLSEIKTEVPLKSDDPAYQNFL